VPGILILDVDMHDHHSVQGAEVTVTASPCPSMSEAKLESEYLWTISGRKRDKPKLESIANNAAAQMVLVTHALRCRSNTLKNQI
jgi:hypothetical protein